MRHLAQNTLAPISLQKPHLRSFAAFASLRMSRNKNPSIPLESPPRCGKFVESNCFWMKKEVIKLFPHSIYSKYYQTKVVDRHILFYHPIAIE